MSLTITRKPEEPDLEYLMRLAAEFICHYAREKEFLSDFYDEDEPETGQELSSLLIEQANELATDRERLGKGMNFRGTIIQAGNDESSPLPSVTIRTTERELKNQKQIPFYKSCEIQISPIQ